MPYPRHPIEEAIDDNLVEYLAQFEGDAGDRTMVELRKTLYLLPKLLRRNCRRCRRLSLEGKGNPRITAVLPESAVTLA